MKRLLLILIIFGCYACINKSSRQAGMPELVVTSDDDSAWVFENENVKQTVVIHQRSDTVILFTYNFFDKNKKKAYEISGEAKHNLEYDQYGLESDEDEDEAYFVTEYVYDGECYLAFRIDMEQNRRMTIGAEESCVQYESQGILVNLLHEEG